MLAALNRVAGSHHDRRASDNRFVDHGFVATAQRDMRACFYLRQTETQAVGKPAFAIREVDLREVEAKVAFDHFERAGHDPVFVGAVAKLFGKASGCLQLFKVAKTDADHLLDTAAEDQQEHGRQAKHNPIIDQFGQRIL